jgi:hypothetical protein
MNWKCGNCGRILKNKMSPHRKPGAEVSGYTRDERKLSGERCEGERWEKVDTGRPLWSF